MHGEKIASQIRRDGIAQALPGRLQDLFVRRCMGMLTEEEIIAGRHCGTG